MLQLKSAWRDGTTHIKMSPLEFMQRLAALVPPPRTIAFADFAGSRQYISFGNLGENDRAFLFLMDYAEARRLKLWGRARVVGEDAVLLARVANAGYPARVASAIVFDVLAWDWNCSQHIPRLVPALAASSGS